MLFKSRELSQAIRPSDIQTRSDIKPVPPPLDISLALQDIMTIDINSNEDLITNMRDQWKMFFFEDLQYFSWNNFISTIQIFCQNGASGTELLTQILKKELRFQMKEVKGSKNSRELYKSLNNLFQRIVVLQKHLNNELNLGAIVLPIVNEETNNLQNYWELFVESSISNNKSIEYLYIFLLIEAVSSQSTSEKAINVFKARYNKIKGTFNDMTQFLLFFSDEHMLVNQISSSLARTRLLAYDLQRIIAQDLLNANIEHFINLSSENIYKRFAEKDPEIIMAFCRILDFPFEKRFFIERYITDLIKKFCLTVIKSKKKTEYIKLITLKEEFNSNQYPKKPDSFFLLLDKCIIQVIEETNGVEKLVSIINKRIIQSYEKNLKEEHPLIERALLYIKYQSNYEAFEEAYRMFLTRRMCIYSNAGFEVEQDVASKISSFLGSEPISLSLTILKDLEISRSLSKNPKSFVLLNTFSYISLPKSFQRDELDAKALKRIDSALDTKFGAQYQQTATQVLASEIFQKRKLTLLYHGSLELFFPKRGFTITLTFVQGLILISLLQSKLQKSLEDLKKLIGLENEILLAEIGPLTNPKCKLLILDGQQVKLDPTEFEKVGQRKQINHFKASSQLQHLKKEESFGSYSEDAQKRMIEAASVKFLKRKKTLAKKNLFELVQADLYRFFNSQTQMFDAVIEQLIQKEYCKKIEGDMLEYLP